MTRDIFLILVRKKFRFKSVMEQIVIMGFESQSVILLTGAFTGAVFAAQSYFQLDRVGLDSMTGSVVSVAMFRELGPVFTGLMITGRVGAAISAQLGTMKVTDQIDALRSMSVSPLDYLVLPRMIAMMISMPIIVAEAVLIGIVSSYVLMVFGYDVSSAWFIHNLKMDTNLHDVSISLVKGIVFGFLIVLISSHQGLKAENGAIDVGRRTTTAVVYSSLIILISNFLLTLILNIFSPVGDY